MAGDCGPRAPATCARAVLRILARAAESDPEPVAHCTPGRRERHATTLSAASSSRPLASSRNAAHSEVSSSSDCIYTNIYTFTHFNLIKLHINLHKLKFRFRLLQILRLMYREMSTYSAHLQESGLVAGGHSSAEIVGELEESAGNEPRGLVERVGGRRLRRASSSSRQRLVQLGHLRYEHRQRARRAEQLEHVAPHALGAAAGHLCRARPRLHQHATAAHCWRTLLPCGWLCLLLLVAE